MITGVMETFAICRWYRFHWPWFSLFCWRKQSKGFLLQLLIKKTQWILTQALQTDSKIYLRKVHSSHCTAYVCLSSTTQAFNRFNSKLTRPSTETMRGEAWHFSNWPAVKLSRLRCCALASVISLPSAWVRWQPVCAKQRLQKVSAKIDTSQNFNFQKILFSKCLSRNTIL